MDVKIAQLAFRIIVMAVVFAFVLFLGAGTLLWPAAWAYLGLFFSFTVGISIWLARFNPGLLAERMTGIGRADQKTWDKVLLAITALLFFAWLALMGLDAARFHWSHVFPGLQVLGALLLLSSFWAFFVTFRENTFLSPAVRIQKDRNQQVVSTGPYSHVRHPMYGAFVVFVLGTALMLGSWLGVLVGVLLVGLVARRAVLEERLLERELDGYSVYVSRVKSRLIPHIW